MEKRHPDDPSQYPFPQDGDGLVFDKPWESSQHRDMYWWLVNGMQIYLLCEHAQCRRNRLCRGARRRADGMLTDLPPCFEPHRELLRSILLPALDRFQKDKRDDGSGNNIGRW